MNEFNGTFELVDPNLIRIDPTYQRGEKDPLIDAIAANPMWEACGAITCFTREQERNGKTTTTYYCVDGQQRLHGLLKTEDPPKAVPVISYAMHNVVDEAAVFVRINEFRKSLTALEKHKGKIVAKDPAAVAIERAATAAGFTIGSPQTKNSDARTIAAVSALNWVYNLVGEEGVTQVLVQIRDAWPDDKAGLESMMLKAVATVIAEQQAGANGGYSRSKLTEALKKTSPAVLMRKAEALRFDLGGSKAVNIRRAIKELAKV